MDRPKIVALDLDGTLLEYDGDFSGKELGGPLKGMLKEIKTVHDQGWKVVIWTCREDTPELRRHLREHGVPFDYVNDHPWNGPDNPRKIHADVYVDDKNVEFHGNPDGLAQRILSATPWWQGAKWL